MTITFNPEAPTTSRAWHAITSYLRERQALGLWSHTKTLIDLANGRGLNHAQAETLLANAVDHGHLEQTHVHAVPELPMLRLVRRCRTCGCTDTNACTPPCWWIRTDLCSACE